MTCTPKLLAVRCLCIGLAMLPVASCGDSAGPTNEIANIEVYAPSTTLAVGATQQLAVTVRDRNGNTIEGRTVQWTSENSAVAGVSSRGIVTGVATGVSEITAAADGKFGSILLTVIPRVASLTIAPGAPTMVVGSSRTLVATLLAPDGSEVRGRSIGWSSGSTNIATVSSDGVVLAIAPGVAEIVATAEGNTGRALVTVVASVAALRLSPTVLRVSVGRTSRLQVELLDSSGSQLTGREIAWTTSAPQIAAISVDGEVTGLAPGTAQISASSEGRSNSANVTVSPSLSITGTDSLLVPGTAFLIRGTGLVSSAVRIGNSVAAVLVSSDTLLSVVVPQAPFTPCLAPRSKLEIVVGNELGDTLRLRRDATERPFTLASAVGAHTQVPRFVFKNCRVSFASAGKYVALVSSSMPAPGTSSSARDSSEVSVFIDVQPQRAADPNRPTKWFPRTTVRGRLSPIAQSSTSGAVDYSVSERGAAQTAMACSLPAPGGLAKVWTLRNDQGQVTMLATSSAGYPRAKLEDWRLLHLGQTVAAFVDSSTERLAALDPRLSLSLRGAVATSDSVITPYLEATTRGFRDLDSNGRVIAYFTANGAPTSVAPGAGYAFPSSSLRVDCGDSTVAAPGESILMGFSQVGVSYNTLVHELAHVADLGWSRVMARWQVEGYAVFAANAFKLRNLGDPLTMNIENFVRGGQFPGSDGDSGASCIFRFQQAFYEAPDGGPWVYPFGCNLIGYVFKLFRDRFGGSLRDIHTAWTRVNASTFDDVERNFLQAEGATGSLLSEWLLSFYADDYVTQTSNGLQQGMLNVREYWRNELSSLGAFPLPDVRFATLPGATIQYLGAPDARWLEFEVPAGALFQVETKFGTDLNERLGLTFLRVR